MPWLQFDWTFYTFEWLTELYVDQSSINIYLAFLYFNFPECTCIIVPSQLRLHLWFILFVGSITESSCYWNLYCIFKTSVIGSKSEYWSMLQSTKPHHGMERNLLGRGICLECMSLYFQYCVVDWLHDGTTIINCDHRSWMHVSLYSTSWGWLIAWWTNNNQLLSSLLNACLCIFNIAWLIDCMMDQQ